MENQQRFETVFKSGKKMWPVYEKKREVKREVTSRLILWCRIRRFFYLI